MEQGLLAIILHAHLPFVRHPEYPEFLEEDWLFEAISETYIPLLNVFEGLALDGVQARVTLGLTPPLCEMLADPMLQQRYLAHVTRLVELCEREVLRTRNHPAMNETARMYLTHFGNARHLFENRYGRNLIAGFHALQEAGAIEIITSGATHGFLPLIANKEARRAQIEVGRRNYWKHFGRAPRGIWLPECAYAAGIDELLRDAGLKFFICDAHAIMFGRPQPRRGIYAPVITRAGVAAFGRDVETSEQVWSSVIGYPGDYDYREFYRDLGFDGDYDYVRPYLHSDGVRRNIGIKYYRVTGKVDLGAKEPYVPAWATQKAAEHAGNFLANRQAQAQHLNSILGRKPLIVSPYDAELFGHWWFEGPQFLNYLIRKAHFDQSEVRLATPIDYLDEYPQNQSQEPAASSWGAEGYYRVWVNGENDWIYLHQHVAEDRMVELTREHPQSDGLLRRALNQAARELLLAESSDWAFIITTATSVQYAIKRFRDHIHRFTRLYEMIKRGEIDQQWLTDVESRDTIFQEMDYAAAYGERI
ncbi:MAG TPA: 1,4-alpha-glucan branching protein domain-containing protein [Blastocatellia bacterium]|jgi:1,4-alpha-glucan branching enzyme|nr:1,4-alpha-glucan branching protein domain-containing protein [Blastocatellia bacterium]